jgi:branched-chain amino acid transport system substrate-binding protein
MIRAIRGIAVAAILAQAAGTPAMAQAPADTVTIGIVSATSGPLAAPGRFQLNGFNLAMDKLNSDGGIEVGGRHYRVALKVYDTHCSPAEGASVMERLSSADKVPVVLGELCSPVAAAEMPVAQDNSVPFIMTVPTAENLTEQGNPWAFRVNADNTQLNKALAQLVVSRAMWPLAFIAWNNDAGRGGVHSMEALLPPDVKVAYTGYFNVGEVDFSAHVSNIRRSGAKAVMLFMDEEPGALAIRQIRDAGLDVQLIGTLAMGSDRFLTRLDAKYLAGMVQYSAFPPNAPLPRIRAFNDAYKAAFKAESHGFAAQSYDGLMVAADALHRAGTVSDGDAIRKALAATSYEGVIGTIRFDAHGQASPPSYVTQWCDNGTRRIVFPTELASGCGGG